MSELVEEGLVRAIGLSNYDVGDIERCHAQRTVDLVQDGLSLVDHLDARARFARCAELGIPVVVYEPLASGVLSGRTMEEVREIWKGWSEFGFYKRMLAPGRAERSQAVVDALRPIASRHGISVAQLALAWVLHQPGVSWALAGSRDGRHVHENAAAAAVDLRASLDEFEALRGRWHTRPCCPAIKRRPRGPKRVAAALQAPSLVSKKPELDQRQ
jgi:aryl-alcohol dehydrogenase-like predicted oxidoreductase